MKEYTKRAQKNYRDKFDTISVIVPKGTKEKIKMLGFSANAYINMLVAEDMKRRKTQTAEAPEQCPF